MFKGYLRQLRQDGEDIVVHHEPIPPEVLKKIRSELDLNNPKQLQQRVFVEIELHFARRGREGLRNLKKESFVAKIDENQREYFCIGHFEIEKTKQGTCKDKENKQARMYATGAGDNCPVAILKKYLSKLNPKSDFFFPKAKDQIFTK